MTSWSSPQVYTTQKGITEIKSNPQLLYITQEGIEEIKSNPLDTHYPRGYKRD